MTTDQEEADEEAERAELILEWARIVAGMRARGISPAIEMALREQARRMGV